MLSGVLNRFRIDITVLYLREN